jgi:hypothetical protein
LANDGSETSRNTTSEPPTQPTRKV